MKRFAGKRLWVLALPAFMTFAAIYVEMPSAFAQVEFLRGDANSDGKVSISDALMTRRFLFNGDLPAQCDDTMDVNDNGLLQLTDAIVNLAFLFLDRDAPAAPFPGLGPDPTEDSGLTGCDGYTVVDPVEGGDLVRLGDVTGSPGDDVEIPVFITNETEVEAIQLVIGYDPALFTPHPDFGTGLDFGGGYYGEKPGGGFASLTTLPGSPHLLVGFVSHLAETGHELPPGVNTLVFKLKGTISPEAAPGTTVSLEPTNGPDGQGLGPAGMRNELTYRGESRYVSGIPLLEGAILNIVGDQTFFVRGDSNTDGKIDITDAQSTLSYLFLTGIAPPCLDALDSNDDGAINISDPVTTLLVLFAGRGSMPPPYPSSGLDPTLDALTCGE